MPSDTINAFLRTEIEGLKAKGLYKAERLIESPQRSGITVNGREVVNFCANNYLGLANHPDIVAGLAAEGATVVGNSPQEFGKEMRDDIVKWAKVIKDANIQF
jgi:glycine C-acetyltransferase